MYFSPFSKSIVAVVSSVLSRFTELHWIPYGRCAETQHAILRIIFKSNDNVVQNIRILFILLRVISPRLPENLPSLLPPNLDCCHHPTA